MSWGNCVAHLGSQDKITTRDSVPDDASTQLRDVLLEVTGRAITSGHNRVILRKLFVAVRRVDRVMFCMYCHIGIIQITSLAIKLHPGRSSRWHDWLPSTLNSFASIGVPREHIMDFLAIVAEEVETTDLLPPHRSVLMDHRADAGLLKRQTLPGRKCSQVS